MIRHALAAAAFLAAPAFAADIDPGPIPGLRLLVDGLPGSANDLGAGGPALDIRLNGEAVKLEETKLSDIAARLGGDVNMTGEEDRFAWVCYAAPDAATGGTTLVWFYAVDSSAALVSGLAVEFAPDEYPEACTRLEAPLALATGLPGLGASAADLEAGFGAAKADSGAPGLTAYIFGAEPFVEGFVSRIEVKYILADDKVVAHSLLTIVEPQ